MEKSVPDNSTRRRGGYALALIALITCPCHLPILAFLLSGTAAGALFTEHPGVAIVLLSLLFLLSLNGAIRLLRGGEIEGE